MSKLDRMYTEVTEATSQPEFAVVQRRVARRRTRRRTLLGVTAAVAALGLVVAAQAPFRLAGGPPAAGPGASDAPAPVPTADVGDGPVENVTAGDDRHLYAIHRCDGCAPRLVASEDRGRTWVDRPVPQNTVRIEATGPRTLLAEHLSSSRPAQLSTDGGASWTPLTRDATPVSRVPAEGLVVCGPGPGPAGDDIGVLRTPYLDNVTTPCVALVVIDPARRLVSPLVLPQGFAAAGVTRQPDAAGVWLTGRDSTGRPAVAVLRGAASSWEVHPLDVALVTGRGMWNRLDVSTHDGTVVHARVGTGQVGHLFRSDDGGRTWHRANGGRTVGPEYGTPVTLPDGTHVLQASGVGSDKLVGRGDGAYTVSPAASWPSTTVQVTPAGTYFAADRTRMYLSADGRTWNQVVPG